MFEGTYRTYTDSDKIVVICYKTTRYYSKRKLAGDVNGMHKTIEINRTNMG